MFVQWHTTTVVIATKATEHHKQQANKQQRHQANQNNSKMAQSKGMEGNRREWRNATLQKGRERNGIATDSTPFASCHLAINRRHFRHYCFPASMQAKCIRAPNDHLQCLA